MKGLLMKNHEKKLFYVMFWCGNENVLLNKFPEGTIMFTENTKVTNHTNKIHWRTFCIKSWKKKDVTRPDGGPKIGQRANNAIQIILKHFYETLWKKLSQDLFWWSLVYSYTTSTWKNPEIWWNRLLLPLSQDLLWCRNKNVHYPRISEETLLIPEMANLANYSVQFH